MARILGLDLGSNSIGWAIIDDSENKIISTGVRVFPEGVEHLGKGEREISRNASRRGARQQRRSHYRRRLRKKKLLTALIENRMCPLSRDDVRAWYDTGKYPNSTSISEWFKLNPYDLRNKAVTECLELHELGRVFFHMSQRRGFLSNKRRGFLSNSRSAMKQEEETIYDGILAEGKAGITETKESLSDKTLGQYLASIHPKSEEPFIAGRERIRNRYTTRQMYIDEFEAIWQTQSGYLASLTPELKKLFGGRKKDGDDLDGILFFQRPLRSQKHLIGNCSLEKDKPRCPVSAIPYELFRVYQFVNNIECNGKKLELEESEQAVAFLLREEKPEFAKLREKLKKTDDGYRFNYQNDDKCPGAYTISNMCSKKFFGERWFQLTEDEQENIWHVLFFFEDSDKLKEYALKHWEFDEEGATKISTWFPRYGHASLSRKAINNILPFLKLGFTFDVAAVLGGVKNAFGKEWDTLDSDRKQFILDNVPAMIRAKIRGGYIDDLRNLLKSEFQLTDKQLTKLYHHSEDIHRAALLDKLPVGREADIEIAEIRNPIVIQALFELRRIVNVLIDEYGGFDEIKIELARDLKVSKMKRYEIRKEQSRLEREHIRIKSRLEELQLPITHENVLRYKLWEECDRISPYSGRQINCQDLFSGEVHIDHIFPWNKSLDDSFLNKTICFANENNAKGNRTPFQYFTEDFGEEKWNEMKERFIKVFYDTKEFPNRYRKFRRLVGQKFDDDFIQRQLNDTRYISREARSYLGKICERVSVAPGALTANLRHKWGLDSILGDDDTKERSDHRHHAIDALVMACFKVSHLQEISRWNRYNRTYNLKDFPQPWDSFRAEAEESTKRILVSHKKRNMILTERMNRITKDKKEFTNLGVAARGQLHKESFYGKRKPPQGEEAFHIRKPLQGITKKTHVDKIVDNRIRELVIERLRELGVDVNEKKYDVPNGAFFTVDEDKRRIPLIFLPNKRGEPVPVYKVRMSESIGNAEAIGDDDNKYVDPRNNHHVLVYRDRSGNLKEKIVTLWEVAEKKRQGSPVFQMPEDGECIIASLQINDVFLLGLREEDIDWNATDLNSFSAHLYRVQKISSADYCFRLHIESTQLNKNRPAQWSIRGLGTGKTGWITANPIKVFVSATGKITPVM